MNPGRANTSTVGVTTQVITQLLADEYQFHGGYMKQKG